MPPRPRELPPFARELLRVVVRFFAAVVRRFVPTLLLRAAPLLFAVLRPDDLAAVLRAVPPLFFAVDDLAFVRVERFAFVTLRAVPVRLVLLPVLVPEPSSGHLPDITRCAASATASAINAPRRVALVITELAAWLAVSAASIPASLIALRAFGLALIAAAAAAKPAASISLLIATFAILSTVLSLDFDRDFDLGDDDFDDAFRVLDLAIANLPNGPVNRHMNL